LIPQWACLKCRLLILPHQDRWRRFAKKQFQLKHHLMPAKRLYQTGFYSPMPGSFGVKFPVNNIEEPARQFPPKKRHPGWNHNVGEQE